MTTSESLNSTKVALDEIGQIAVTVTDLARSRDFYQNILGMHFLFDAGSMVFFQCGTIRFAIGTSGTSTAPSGTILYFRVPDIQSAHETLAARGVVFTRSPFRVARMANHDLWLAPFRDPDGNPIELMCELPHADSSTAG